MTTIERDLWELAKERKKRKFPYYPLNRFYSRYDPDQQKEAQKLVRQLLTKGLIRQREGINSNLIEFKESYFEFYEKNR
ncbi:MAG: hypothetical protein HRT61_00745 [Ekhidna sp.]|nr:hypothetical protein [Ekhidna sp.]